MLALRFHESKAEIMETETPVPAEDEALIRVDWVGVCNTDLELLAGYYGFSGIAGHEFVGRVVEAPGRPDLAGKRVTADINCGCGDCALCLAGDSRHCPGRTVTGIVGRPGAFAQYLTTPLSTLHLIPDGLEDRRAVFTEPLAAALEPAQQMLIQARDRVLVLGDGKLGLLTALGLRLQNPGLVLAGKHDEKLAIARDKGVETRLVDPEAPKGGLEELIREQGLFDVVIEATGNEHGLGLALDCVRPEGTVVAKTTSRKHSCIDLAKVVVEEISIVGSRCGDPALALHHLAAGLVDPTPLIQAEFPFGRITEALELAKEPGSLKVLVNME